MKQLGIVLLFGLYSIIVFAVGLVVGLGMLGQFESFRSDTPDELRTEFAPFWEVWNVVNREYFEQPLRASVLVEGAIEGMLSTLEDPNTRYVNPDEQRIEEEDMDGEFQGIGARIEFIEDVGVVIVSPIVGSPAEAAGLRPGDVIKQADGTDLPDVDIAVRLVRGPAGEPVVLTIERDGETFELEVIRGVIEVPSVTSEMLSDGDIAYIQLTQFGIDSAEEFEKALNEVLANNPQGLIVDLRNNPGGLLGAVNEIGDLLLADGVLLIEESGNGGERTYRTEDGDVGETIPLVVMINEGSASASEVLAGAIAARDRGELVGVQSFGKGTVQSVEPLSNGGALRVTISHWLTPADEWIHEEGVTPDIIVEMPEVPGEEDPQLDAALDVLLGQGR